MPNIIVWDGTTQVPSDVSRALIIARDGMFQLKRIALNGLILIEAVTKIAPGWVEEEMCDWGAPRLQLGFAEKIPQTVLQQAIAFFGAVYNRFQTESVVLLFYAPQAATGQKWRVLPPEQEVTGAACQYSDPGPAPAGWFLAGTIHSHGNMGAFHSGTDDRDEQDRDGIHITVGGVNSLPSFAVSAVVDGERFKLELADVVEGIAQTVFPQNWLDRVSKPAPQIVQKSAYDWLNQRNFSPPSSDGEEDVVESVVSQQRVASPTTIRRRSGGKRK